MKNRILLMAWSLLALFRVSRRRVSSNRAANRKLLRAGGFCAPGEYIEDQARWGALRFGTKYDMAYGGCGIIAVYNVMVSLGLPVGAEDMEYLMDAFQRRGAAAGGRFGLSPGAIRRFLERNGFRVSAVVPSGDAAVDALSSRGDTFLVTARNGRRLSDMIHTVCITRDGQGGFLVHNGYHLAQRPDGGKIYCANGPFSTLSEAVRHISAQGAAPVMAMGISVESGTCFFGQMGV